MDNELVPVSIYPVPAIAAIGPAELLDHWLAGRSPRTVRAYQSDLEHFARSIGVATGAAAVGHLLIAGPAAANAVALGYRNAMLEHGLAGATVARRLASLRSVVALANLLGMVPWHLGIQSPKVEPRRDVRGPDPAERKRIWRALRQFGDAPKARRDRAIVALLFDLALRRGEVVGLDLADFDHQAILVQGKGKREKIRLTLPPATHTALVEWIDARGSEPGPLFTRLDRGSSPERLTGDGLALVIRTLGAASKLGRRLRPHGFRHAAITAALDSGSDVRQVRKFSRHAKLETVIRYDDARDDTAGKIAASVSRERK